MGGSGAAYSASISAWPSAQMVAAVVHTANIRDRDCAPGVLTSIRASFPWLRHMFADGGYTGEKLEAALKGKGEWTLEIIKRSDTIKGFVLLPR